MDNVFQHIKIRNLLVWIIFTIFILMVFGALTIPIFNSSGTLLFLLSLLGTWTMYITPVLWLLIKLRNNNSTIHVLFRSNSTVGIKDIVAITFMSYIFIHGLSYLWEGITSAIGVSEFKVLSIENINIWANILSIITMVLIAPICEEIIFRGILLGRLTAKFNVKTAIILSSVIFGLLHVTGFIYFTLFGVLLSVLFIKSNSLMAPIIVHIIFNTISTILDNYFRIANMPNGFIGELSFVKILIISTILIVTGLSMVILFLRKNWSLVIRKGYPF